MVGSSWTPVLARALAGEHLAGMGRRWAHVQGVGCYADALAADGLVNDVIVMAAWLHDIGYAPSVAVTGFHPLDGARFLAVNCWPDEVVALVWHHTGAVFEAEERGLLNELAQLPVPKREDLDVVTTLDLMTSPDGDRIDPADRIAEILMRYPADSEVHRAVSRSRASLLAAAARSAMAYPGSVMNGCTAISTTKSQPPNAF